MEKKKRIVLGIIAILILALIFLIMIFSRLYDSGSGGNKGGFSVFNDYNLASVNNQGASGENILVPSLQDGVAIQASAEKSVDYPEPFKQVDFRPLGDSAQQKEQIIKIGAMGFEPKEVHALYPAKVILTFEAIDDNPHEVIFEDNSLAYLNFSFSRVDGSFTKTFMAPKPGNYSFYIDRPENRGSFKVTDK